MRAGEWVLCAGFVTVFSKRVGAMVSMPFMLFTEIFCNHLSIT
jgi:hypothetical protein